MANLGALSEFLLYLQEGPNPGDAQYLQLQPDYTSKMDCHFKTVQTSIEFLDLSSASWLLYMIGADSDGFGCSVGDRLAVK